MKKVLHCFLAFAIHITLLQAGIPAFAQSGTASITIHLINRPEDTISVNLIRDSFTHQSINFSYETLKGAREGNSFRFLVTGLESPGYIQLRSAPGRIPHYKDFIIAPNDSVVIEVRPNTLAFSGHGAAKWECLYRIDSTFEGIVDRRNANSKPINKAKLIDQDIRATFSDIHLGDSLFRIKMQVLDLYRNKIDPSIRELMVTNLYSERKVGLLAGVNISKIWCYKYPDSLRRVKIVYEYFKKHIAADTLTTSYRSKTVSSSFVRYIVLSTLMDEELRSKRSDGGVDKRAVYRRLMNQYKTAPLPFREKLQTAFLMTTAKDHEPMVAEMEHLAASLSSDHYRQIMADLAEKLRQGRPAYAFSLPDSTGRIYTLADFKGKVLLIDFWFTGCTFCKVLNKSLRPVYEKYKDNDQVAFVSVNIDRERETWIKSLAPVYGYIDPVSVNLYAQGDKDNMNTEIMDYYFGSAGCPQLVLIDQEGKVVTTKAKVPPPNVKVADYLDELLTRHINTKAD